MGKMVEEDLEGTGWATGKMQCIEVHYDRKSEIRVPSHLLPHFYPTSALYGRTAQTRTPAVAAPGLAAAYPRAVEGTQA